MNQKTKITGQLVKNVNGYTAYILIDGQKHTHSIRTEDKAKANEQFKHLLERAKRIYSK